MLQTYTHVKVPSFPFSEMPNRCSKLQILWSSVTCTKHKFDPDLQPKCSFDCFVLLVFAWFYAFLLYFPYFENFGIKIVFLWNSVNSICSPDSVNFFTFSVSRKTGDPNLRAPNYGSLYYKIYGHQAQRQLASVDRTLVNQKNRWY